MYLCACVPVHTNWKERHKMAHVHNQTDYLCKKIPRKQLVQQMSLAQLHKINIQKSVIFLYTVNEQLETEI